MRKRWRILIGAVVIVALLWAWLMFRLFGPSTRIVVSPQTTIITAPLGPDGLPEFELPPPNRRE